MSVSGLTNNLSGSRTSTSSSAASRELCVACNLQPYDVICTCGDKFDFAHITAHVQQLSIEFGYNQNEAGERLLQVEEIIDDHPCANARTTLENWKRKRLQDIDDIFDQAMDQIDEREKVYSEVPAIRTQYNNLFEQSQSINHEQLDSIMSVQRQVVEKLHQLDTLPELPRDYTNLDLELRSKLHRETDNPTSFSGENELVHCKSTSTATNANGFVASEPTSPASTAITKTDPSMNIDPTVSTTMASSRPDQLIDATSTACTSNTNLAMNTQPSVELTNSGHAHYPTAESTEPDEFDLGLTAIIQRRNTIIIAANNDKFVATVCCRENQLLYNDYNQRAQRATLVYIPDIGQPMVRQTINWPTPDRVVGGGDDYFIQDITYSTRLQGYLLLNNSRLRLLRDVAQGLEEFFEFPDRTMKRVTCDQRYIYLISASGATAQHGDEIILMNYAKAETVCKTFREIVSVRNYRTSVPIIGELTDLAVSGTDQILFGYRLERRREVGVCLCNVSNDGKDWSCAKQLLLNECWHDALSYTPRMEWCEKFQTFILLEHFTGHLIMLDRTGQVKGECNFKHVENRRDLPLNQSISDRGWFCVRYESSINIHRLEEIKS